MAYQVLARKWRPRSFHEMVGQTHVLKALVNALDSQRIHHAYLFTGTRGVGKTTISRIFAKCLNCEKGISATPCGVCSICQEVDAGRFVDLIEIDAASRTKVEDTRDILDNVQYAPSRGRYKIYLIDEVHMLSTHSFNALLKTLEEPPEHVKFLLATTDPQKLPVTILSRCLQFSLKSISSEQITKHLSVVLEAEKISFDVDALRLIARSAEGSMRDAMSLTDQSIAFGNGQVLLPDVRNMLGSIDKKQVYLLLELFFSRNLKELFSFIEEVAAQDINWIDFLSELIQVFHQVAIAQILPDAIDNASGQRETILGFAQRIPAEDVHLFYQMGLVSRRDLSLAPDLRAGFEMALLRMLAFRTSQVDDESILSVKSGDISKLSSELSISTLPMQVLSGDDRKQPVSYVESNEVTASYETSSGDYDAYIELESCETTALIANPIEASISSVNTVSVDQVTVEDLHKAELTETDLTKEWLDLFPRLNLSGVLSNVAANSALVQKDDNIWTFHLAPNCAALLNENHSARLSEALFSLLAMPTTAKIKVNNSSYLTPAKVSLLHREQRQKQAEQDMESDGFLLELKNGFAAEVILNSIEPV